MQKLIGQPRHYAWGSFDAIPAWLGTEPTGQPFAEYWLGAHPSGSAVLAGPEQLTLHDAIQADPGLLGSDTRDRFGDELPFMLKILSARRALSLQTHPPAELAAEGFEREEAAGLPIDDPKRSFKDRNAKPELALALTPFEALVGFRDPQRTVELFDALQVQVSLESVIGPLRHRAGAAALAEVFLDALVADDERAELTKQIVVAALAHVDDDGEVGEFARTIVTLDSQFPGDPSLIGAMLMNHFTLQPGQAIHLTPGVLHAYISGTCVEIMGNSDNVLRGGLTSKHIDPGALVQVANFDPAPISIVPASQLSAGLTQFEIDEETFALWQLDGQPEAFALPAASDPRILVIWDGEFDLIDDEQQVTTLRRGEAAFLAAGEQALARGAGLAYLAAPGRPVAVL